LFIIIRIAQKITLIYVLVCFVFYISSVVRTIYI